MSKKPAVPPYRPLAPTEDEWRACEARLRQEKLAATEALARALAEPKANAS